MRRAAQRKAKKASVLRSHKRTIFYSILCLVLLLFSFSLFKYWPKNWDENDKFVVAEQNSEGVVVINIVDPTHAELTSLVIPARTQVQVSRNLGEYTIGNVWKLGINENLTGVLLTETLVKNFSIPVYLYLGPNGESNMTLGDKLIYKYYLSKYKATSSNVIDLGKSQFLKRLKLTDGEFGFRLEGVLSPRITVFFGGNDLGGQASRVEIINATGKSQGEIVGRLENLTNLISTIGSKVASIQTGDETYKGSEDCQIYGKDKKLVKKLSKVLGCSLSSGNEDYDAVIILRENLLKKL